MKTSHNNAGAPHILVVDDEAAIATLVAETLRRAGMEACVFTSSAEALAAAQEQAFDLAILDIMMPGMDGLELCTHLKSISDMPVIFLTAKDAESDLVVGFALGAADYIVKPFKPRELVARVQARLKNSVAHASYVYMLGCGIEIDIRAHAASLHGVQLVLTPKEFALLAQLAEHAGAPVAAKDLFEAVWQEPYDTSAANSVMVHIRHLRAKLVAVDGSQEFIETVWGIGYKLKA